MVKCRRLDCVFYDELLGFEKYPPLSIKKIHAHDPLEEIDIGDGSKKRSTYISSKIEPEFKV